MRKIKIFVGGFLVTALVFIGIPTFADMADSQVKFMGQVISPDYKAGQVLVKYRTPVRAAAARHFQEEYGISVAKTLKSGVQLVKLPPELSVEEALAIYDRSPNVVYAEPNYRYFADVIPNDPDFSKLWGLHSKWDDWHG